MLGALAAPLIVISAAMTHLLIPLYAVGVFIYFTMSQTGMVRHWLRERSPGYRRRLAINAFGARPHGRRRGHRHLREVLRRRLAGARLIPLLVAMMSVHPARIRRDQEESSCASARTGVLPGPHREQRVIVPVNGINRAVVQAVNFGRL